MGDMFRPSRSSSGPNLRVQVLYKLTHKMQVGIPVSYSVCKVKFDKINTSNGLFYQVLLHIHCKQLGSQLAFYELIYVRPVLLN